MSDEALQDDNKALLELHARLVELALGRRRSEPGEES